MVFHANFMHVTCIEFVVGWGVVRWCGWFEHEKDRSWFPFGYGSRFLYKKGKRDGNIHGPMLVGADAPAIGAVGVSAIHGPCDGLAYV